MNDNNEYNQALIITDSMGAPRENVLTYYQETWVSYIENYFLEKYKIKTFSYTQPGLNTNRLLEQVAMQLQFYRPKIVILQIGNIDHASRLIRLEEMDILRKVFPARFYREYEKFRRFCFVSPLLKNIRFRKDVSEAKFIQNLKTVFSNYFKDAIILTIPINYPTKRYKVECSFAEKNIKKYNEFLGSFKSSRYFYLKDLETIFIKDIYKILDKKNRHYILEGHKVIKDYIIKELDKIEFIYKNFTLENENMKDISFIPYNLELFLKTKINSKIIYIYGFGEYSKLLIKFLCNCKVNIKSIIDDNTSLLSYKDIPILNEFKMRKEIESKSVIFIASSKYERKIYNKIKDLEKQNITIVKTYTVLKSQQLTLEVLVN